MQQVLFLKTFGSREKCGELSSKPISGVIFYSSQILLLSYAHPIAIFYPILFEMFRCHVKHITITHNKNKKLFLLTFLLSILFSILLSILFSFLLSFLLIFLFSILLSILFSFLLIFLFSLLLSFLLSFLLISLLSLLLFECLLYIFSDSLLCTTHCQFIMRKSQISRNILKDLSLSNYS